MTWQQVVDSDVFGTDELDWRLEVSERLEGGWDLSDDDFARLRALIVRTQAAMIPGDGNQARLAHWLAQLDTGVRELRAWESDAEEKKDRAEYAEHIEKHPSRKRGIGM